MATFRVGVGSFNIKDGAVGFGTDTDGLGNLRVKGVTKTTGSIVSGASTLTRYAGFAADNINQLENITLTSEVGTIGDIVVGVGTSVIISSASTVTVGTVESVSIGTHFSPPTGGIEERGQDFVEGMMRFNTDLNTMEFYNGNEWRQFRYILDIQNSPSSRGRGLIGGGYEDAYTREIQSLNIHTFGDAVNNGDLSNVRARIASVSNEIRGIWGGGQEPSYVQTMDFREIASSGDVVSFGSLSGSVGRGYAGGFSSSTRGLFCGGYTPSPSNQQVNIIDKVEIMTRGNAVDFGDLRNKTWYPSSFSSPTRGIIAGGLQVPQSPNNPRVSDIDFITISNGGNSFAFGDLIGDQTQAGGGYSSGVRGVIAGGTLMGTNTTKVQFINIASTGNAIHFGNLTYAARNMTSFSSITRGITAGGRTPTGVDDICAISISSGGDAVDFGDLIRPNTIPDNGGLSDCHGGLGGY